MHYTQASNRIVRTIHSGAARWLVWLLTAGVVLAGCGTDGTDGTPPAADVATATLAPRATFTPAAASPTPAPTDTSAPTATPTPAATATSTPNPNVNPLTGLPVDDPAVLTRRPLLVRVGNDPVARSIQSGLSEAELVYEEIMDGWGVTRYTAVYLAAAPEVIRPVRSARLINIQLALQYDGALAHSGASDPIRLRISQAPFVDLDEFFHSAPYTYGQGDWRTRLYTTAPRLRDYLERQGLEEDVDLNGWHFNATPPADGVPAEEIYIPYPNGAVTWRYNSSTDLYERFVDGARSVDANNGEQIAVANVIGLYTEHGQTDIVEDSLGSTAIDIRMMGEGPLELYRDGVLVEGTWRRSEASELAQFYTEDGDPLQLKPGQSWIEVLPTNVEGYDIRIREP